MKNWVEIYYEGDLNMRNAGFENPSEEAHRRVMEILKDPSKAKQFSEKGEEIISYRQALEIVLREDPELNKIYTDGSFLSRQENSKGKKREAALNKIVFLAKEKTKANKKLSFSEAVKEIHDKNPELVREYQD